MPSLMLTAFLILFLTVNTFAANEMLKTSKVKVGEPVPLTDSLKRSMKRGK